MATGKAETEVREEATESSDPFRTSFFPDRRVISVRAFPFPYQKSGFIWAWVDTVSIDYVSTGLETVGEILWSPLRKYTLTL